MCYHLNYTRAVLRTPSVGNQREIIQSPNVYLNYLCKILICWVSKMVIPGYGVSEGEALCDWIY